MALASIVWAGWCGRSADAGQRLEAYCAARGGLWVKLGQLLALRTDLFPAAFCAPLRALHSRNGVGAVAVVTRERVGGKWRAVKRRLPDAPASFARDLRQLERWAWWLSWVKPRWQPLEFVEELRRVMAEELDFRFESAHLRAMRPILKAHGITVPKVYGADADRLVLQWIDGLLMAEYLERPVTIRNRRVARTLMLSLFRQVFEDNRFHGDLHPGNIIILKDGGVALIDFGTVGRTEAEFLTTFRDQLRAMATGHYAYAADLTLLLCAGLPAGNQARCRSRLVQVMQDWAARSEVPGLPYASKSLCACTEAMSAVVLEAKGRFEWGWLRIQRTFTTLDASLAVLWPTVNYAAVLRRYLADAQRRQPWTELLEAVEVLRRLPAYARLELRRLHTQQVQVKVGL